MFSFLKTHKKSFIVVSHHIKSEEGRVEGQVDKHIISYFHGGK